MLTYPILMTCWAVAAVSLVTIGFAIAKGRPWFAALAYLSTGFFAVALPFKLALNATSLFAILFLSLIWPLWLGQSLVEVDILSVTPDWFNALLFNLD